MKIFLAIFVTYIVFSAWIAIWFWRYLKGITLLRIPAVFLIVCLTVLFPFYFRYPGNSAVDLFLMRSGSIWAGVFAYTFAMVFVADVFFLFASKRKKNKRMRLMACMLVFLLSVVIGILGWLNASNPVLSESTLNVSVSQGDSYRLAGKGIRVAVLSDIHLGRLVSADQFDKMTTLLQSHQPDLVLFAGDILDDHVLLDADAMRKSLGRLNPRYGVWGCLGNHEYHSGPVDRSLSILKDMGIRMLVDQSVVIDGSILLIGREDRFGRNSKRYRKSINEILAPLPKEFKKLPMIIMDHQPVGLEEAEQAGALLQVSGHTHRGQLWPGNLLVNRIYENPSGWSKRGSTHYLVSNGAATWGPPIRTTSRSEVNLIKIRFTK